MGTTRGGGSRRIVRPSPVAALVAVVVALIAAPTDARQTQDAAGRPVPILMYHVIGTAPAGAPFPELFVTPRVFAAQMTWLAGHGYTAVTLAAVYRSWRAGGTLPRHPIVLSFDDGYAGDHAHALPTLRTRRWPGVLNLEVRNETSGELPARWIRALITAGWEIDAHTLTHPDLTRIGDRQLIREVAGSREVIRRQFHVPVDFFCYPAGRYDARVVAAVRAAGFLGATTTNYGLARPGDLLTLDRVRVNGSDGVSGLAAKLRALHASG